MGKGKPLLEVSRYRYQWSLTAFSTFWCLEFHCHFQCYLNGYLYSFKEEHMWEVGFYFWGLGLWHVRCSFSEIPSWVQFRVHLHCTFWPKEALVHDTFFSYFFTLRCSDWSEDRHLCDQFWPCVRHWHGKYGSWKRKREKKFNKWKIVIFHSRTLIYVLRRYLFSWNPC